MQRSSINLPRRLTVHLGSILCGVLALNGPAYADGSASDIAKTVVALSFAILGGPGAVAAKALEDPCPVVRTVVTARDTMATENPVFYGEMRNDSQKDSQLEKQIELEVSATVNGGIDIKALKLGIELGAKAKYSEKAVYIVPPNTIYQLFVYPVGIKETGYQERATRSGKECPSKEGRPQPFTAFIPTGIGHRVAQKK